MRVVRAGRAGGKWSYVDILREGFGVCWHTTVVSMQGLTRNYMGRQCEQKTKLVDTQKS